MSKSFLKFIKIEIQKTPKPQNPKTLLHHKLGAPPQTPLLTIVNPLLKK